MALWSNAIKYVCKKQGEVTVGMGRGLGGEYVLRFRGLATVTHINQQSVTKSPVTGAGAVVPPDPAVHISV